MKEDRTFYCGMFAFAAAAACFAACLNVPEWMAVISNYGNINILTYGLSLLVFCLLFTIGAAVTTAVGNRRKKRRDIVGEDASLKSGSGKKKNHIHLKRGVMMTAIAAQALFFAVGMTMENEQVGSVTYKYGWHTQPLVFAFVLFAVETIAFFRLYTIWERREEERIFLGAREGDWLVRFVYLALTVLIFYSMDNPNIFGREPGDSFHAHAYFNSIYNVHMGLPYTAELTSIYGHYALFWKIPMKLIDGDFRLFTLMMAGLGALVFVLAFTVLDQIVKSRLVKIMAAMAMAYPILGLRGGFYWQLWPHRFVFPVILMVYAWQISKRKAYRWYTALIGYVLCLLAVVWNTETGVVLSVAWAAFFLSRRLGCGDRSFRKVLGSVMFHIIGILGSFLGAYGLVNLYNILKGGPVNTLQEFLIPLLSDSYMVDVLHLDLPMYPAAYMAVLLLFLTGTAMGIRTWFVREEENTQVSFLFFLSISALGRITYYINRPSYYNLDCCWFALVIFLAWFGQKGLVFVRKRKWRRPSVTVGKTLRGTVGVICATVLLALSSGLVLQFSQNSAIKKNFHNTEEFNNFIAEIEEEVPEDTLAFGVNISEIYSALHWNTGCYTIDFSDIYTAPQSIDTVMTALQDEQTNSAFTGIVTLANWENIDPDSYAWFTENYHVEKTFSIETHLFYYYVRNTDAEGSIADTEADPI